MPPRRPDRPGCHSVTVIRAFEEADWDEAWPIFREVVRAAETFTYDPAMTEAAARESGDSSGG